MGTSELKATLAGEPALFAHCLNNERFVISFKYDSILAVIGSCFRGWREIARTA